MGKVVHEFETLYDIGDVVIFDRDCLSVGIVEGYYVDDGVVWYNIRISQKVVYTYTNQGDIGEFDILGKLDGALKEMCLEHIKTH